GMAGYAGETVTSVVARLNMHNPEYGPGELAFTLRDPAGDSVTLDPREFSLNGANDGTYYWQVDPTMSGASALFASATVGGGSWSITVADQQNTSNGTGGTVNEGELTLHTGGGPEPIARTGTWTSPVVDTTT